MSVELECQGRVSFGKLCAESVERLGAVAGDWLEYAPDRNAVVVRHVQPGGPPVLAAVSAELVTFLDLVTAAERDAMPGGSFLIRSELAPLLRIVVARGELRIQWPHRDWAHAVPVSVDQALGAVDAVAARVSGRVELRTKPGRAKELTDFVDRFEGLYPEGDLETELDGSTLRAELRDVNVGPAQLCAKLRELADPIESLRAELDVSSFAARSAQWPFRLTLRGKETTSVRPEIWTEAPAVPAR